MAEWRNGGIAAGMAEWQKEWQNGRMAGMATYVLFMVHTDTDTTLIFYSIEGQQLCQRGHYKDNVL
jgi:hypothetical protein